jgi:hypothetical protein
MMSDTKLEMGGHTALGLETGQGEGEEPMESLWEEEVVESMAAADTPCTVGT